MKPLTSAIRLAPFFALIFFAFSCKKSEKPVKVDNFLTVSKTEILVKSSDSFKDTITISSNQNWRITGLPDWITASASQGTGNMMVVLSISANSSNTSREVTFKIAIQGIEKTIHVSQPALVIDTSQPITVTQTGNYLDVSESPAYLSFPGGSAFDFAAGQSFSISMKMKTTYQPSGNERIIKARNGTGAGYEIISSTTGQMGLNVTTTDGEGLGSKYGTTNVYDGKWHHVVAVFDAAAKKSFFYIDGKTEGEWDHSGGRYASVTARSSILFGVNDESGTAPFRGFFDDVKFWRKALSKTEVYADAANTKINGAFDGLISWWNFENGNTQNTSDSSNTISGTLRNGARLSQFPASTQSRIPVYISGTEGYMNFRIPAIIKAPNGNLLAFADGRVNTTADFGNVDIVMKKSSDGGKTWSPLKVIADNGDLQASNSAPVVDMTDPAYPNGRIFVFYNTGNMPEGDVRNGNGERRVWYKTSTDNGETWSYAVEITSQVKSATWRTYANTPGHAMQFTQGIYRGRIYVAANHNEGPPQSGNADYQTHGFYTDDHGASFHLSDNISIKGSNEAIAAELSDNRLMMNIRNQGGNPRSRIVAISNNGGQTWASEKYDPNLPDPVCQGSLLNIGFQNNKALLAFSNNNNTTTRQNLTLRISLDEGNSWTKSFLVDYDGSSTAYSDLVMMNANKVGVLYERCGTTEITFTVIDWQ